MNKLEMLKMLLEACGNAGEGAARLAMMYYGMELTKFVLLLLFWSGVLWAIYQFLTFAVRICNRPTVEAVLVEEVRDALMPNMAGSLVDTYERNRVMVALCKAGRERKT